MYNPYLRHNLIIYMFILIWQLLVASSRINYIRIINGGLTEHPQNASTFIKETYYTLTPEVIFRSANATYITEQNYLLTYYGGCWSRVSFELRVTSRQFG